MVIFLSIVCMFLAATSVISWREGFDAGRSRARRDGIGINSNEFAANLAKLLDVQADGGDSPVAYVKWAIQEAKKETRP
ncbi:hypothetical protein [Lysobacter enzymogenes]|uniref:hypothetical protein n=1 Tax=Lysobacter enzymogenes TaxID=69 RepID=UPI001A95A974|nr:hypothetical protein [Lysobacter enzymogenes]QQP96466.1 hypothetical protein JHW38_25270 [Lysobacter enzymogenes]QQP96500.1 hypothetical protein JHW38_00120 [Lysobacter enzymogenes]